MPLPCRFDAVSGYGDGKADIFIAHIMDDTVSVFHAILISGKQPLDRSLRRRAVLIILAEPSILLLRYSPPCRKGEGIFRCMRGVHRFSGILLYCRFQCNGYHVVKPGLPCFGACPRAGEQVIADRKNTQAFCPVFSAQRIQRGRFHFYGQDAVLS